MESPTYGKRPSFIRQGKSLHQNKLSYRVFQKNCQKRGTKSHNYMTFQNSLNWKSTMQCSPFLAISRTPCIYYYFQNQYTDKAFNIIITFYTKVGVDNHNLVKTSNLNKPGATPHIFCKVCVIAEPKNWPIDQENSIEKTRKSRKREKIKLVFFCFHL